MNETATFVETISTPSAQIATYAYHRRADAGLPLVIALHGGGFSARYFDRPGYSLIDAAHARGLDVTLIDRPGYGASSALDPRTADVLTDNATALNEAIAQHWNSVGSHYNGVFLIGHSIGGAIGVILAGLERSWPLLGISVAGVALEPPPGFSISEPTLTRELLEMLFFANGAATQSGIDAMQDAAFPAIVEEIVTITGDYAENAVSYLSKVTVSAQVTLAEEEKLWQVGPEVVQRLTAALSASALVDVSVFPGVGHCAEFHPNNRAYYDHILDFVERGTR